MCVSLCVSVRGGLLGSRLGERRHSATTSDRRKELKRLASGLPRPAKGSAWNQSVSLMALGNHELDVFLLKQFNKSVLGIPNYLGGIESFKKNGFM